MKKFTPADLKFGMIIEMANGDISRRLDEHNIHIYKENHNSDFTVKGSYGCHFDIVKVYEEDDSGSLCLIWQRSPKPEQGHWVNDEGKDWIRGSFVALLHKLSYPEKDKRRILNELYSKYIPCVKPEDK